MAAGVVSFYGFGYKSIKTYTEPLPDNLIEMNIQDRQKAIESSQRISEESLDALAYSMAGVGFMLIGAYIPDGKKRVDQTN